MDIQLKIKVTGLCIVRESEDAAPHQVIAVRARNHRLVLKVPSDSYDYQATPSWLAELRGPSIGDHVFRFDGNTEIQVPEPDVPFPVANASGVTPIDPAALGLAPLGLGTGMNVFGPFEAGRISLPSKNASRAWKQHLGCFKLQSGHKINVADSWVWQGIYRNVDHVDLAIREGSGSWSDLSLRDPYLSISLASVTMSESGQAFSHCHLYSNLLGGMDLWTSDRRPTLVSQGPCSSGSGVGSGAHVVGLSLESPSCPPIKG